MFSVHYSEKARKQLSKLDKHTANIIYSWIGKNLENCTDPYAKGKPLVGDRKGTWRYRVGRYRIIVDIQDDKLIILVLAVGDRKNVYND